MAFSCCLRWAVLQLRLFFIALQYFTRLPIPDWVGFESQWVQQSMRFFPLVGILIGVLGSVAYWIAHAFLPQQVSVIISVATGIILTGALHEDGFADVCDGFGSGGSVERVLEIMKDSRLGTYGVLGIGLLLALKCVSLSAYSSRLLPLILVIAHSVSRLFAVVLMRSLDYVRVEGKARLAVGAMSWMAFAFAIITTLFAPITFVYLGWIQWQSLALGICFAIVPSLYLSNLFFRKIGGYTGDCLGAIQQVAEVGLYLGFLAY